MKRAVLPTLALLFVTAVAGCNGGPEVEWSPPAGYAGMVNPKGQTVILVIDRSLSMRTTDPGNFNIAGAQIAVSILEDEDNVGIVTFAAKAQVVAPTQSLKSHDVRAELRQKLEAIEMTGMATDFTQGLGMAKALLDPLKLVKERVSVVFLTDGSHSVFDTKEYIPELIDTIKAKGWKVFSIAFGGQIGKEDEKGLLQEMALKTKGAYFKIRRPRDLPGAFIQIFSQIKDFMTYKGKGDLVVQPMLKRLLFLMTKRRPSDSFRRILRDGQDLDLVAEKAFHYPEAPASGGRLSRFEIVSFSNPKVGAYALRYPKGPEVWKLATFPLKVSLTPGSPPSQTTEGDPVPVEVTVVCETVEMAAAVRDTGSVNAWFTPTGAKEPSAKIACLPIAGKGKTVSFKGSAPLALATKGKEDVFEVQVTFGLVDDQGGAWEIKKRTSVRLLPGPPPLLRVNPPQVNFGKSWADQGPFEIALTLTTAVSGDVKVTVASKSEHMTAEPAALTLSIQNPGEITVRIDPTGLIAAGTRKGVLNLDVSASGGGRSRTIAVPVIFDIYTWQGPTEIEFDHIPPGHQIARTFKVRVTPAIRVFEATEAFVATGEHSIPVIAMTEHLKGKEAEEPLPAETPGEETPETPGEETPETPGEETPETPGEETPETPGEETPETPGEETPETPGEETPETPGEETPETPGEETPETPGEETPETPGEETPETPGEETPETPGEETPETPGEETPEAPEESGLERSLGRAIGEIRSRTGLTVFAGHQPDGTSLEKAETVRMTEDAFRAFADRLDRGEIDGPEFLRLSTQAAGCGVEMLAKGVYRVYVPPDVRFEDFGPDRTPEEIEKAQAELRRAMDRISLPGIEGEEPQSAPGQVVSLDVTAKPLIEAATAIAGQAGVVISVKPEPLAATEITLHLPPLDWRLALCLLAEQARCRIRLLPDKSYELFSTEEKDQDETADKNAEEPASPPSPEEGTEEPAPEEGTEEPAPEEGTEEPAPEEGTEEPAPEEGTEEPAPEEGTEEPAPEEGTEEPAPEEGTEEPAPEEGTEEPAPEEGTEEPAPEEGTEEPAPEEGTEEPAPEEGTEEPAPEDGTEEPAPEEGTEEPAPEEGTEEPAPEEGTEEPAPEEGTEEPAPEEGTEEPAPEEGTEGPAPEKGEKPDKSEKPQIPSTTLKVTLNIPTTSNTPEGLYIGKLVFSTGGPNPLVREIPLKAPISLPAPKLTFKKAVIDGEPDEKGYVIREIEFQLGTPFPTELAVEITDLRPEDPKAGVVSKTFDIRALPREGWDGRTMEPGRTYKLEYRAFFSSDLLPGLYTGTMIWKMKSRGKETVKEIPVKIQLKG